MCFVLIIDICSKQQISHKLRLTQYNQKEIKKIEIHMRNLIIVCYIIWQKCMIFFYYARTFNNNKMHIILG